MAQNDKTIFNGRENNPLDAIGTMGSFFNGADPTTFADIELESFIKGLMNNGR